MTITAETNIASRLGHNWQRMKFWGISHAVNDLYQGLAPAAMPFFIVKYGYDYSTAASLILAPTLGSSLPQPIFGIMVDHKHMNWMAPTGTLLAGLGFGFSGIVPSYTVIWFLWLISGIGISMYHPAAGKGARHTAGNSASAMSIFATGGSIGFSLAPLLAAPLFIHIGLAASIIFLIPALLMAALLQKKSVPLLLSHMNDQRENTKNHWGYFTILTVTEIIRSIIFIGINTFITLFWIHHFHSSTALGETALALFLIGTVMGTLLGGKLSDQKGLISTVRFGSLLAFPALAILSFVPNQWADLPIALIAGICVNIPFAVLVKLGQDYLPQHPGTSAGITLGIAVSIGGLFTPILGMIADQYGIQKIFILLTIIPLLSFLFSLFLRIPSQH